MRRYELGDRATGVVADENDWIKSGPRTAAPKRTAWGMVTGLFANTNNAVIIKTKDDETLCIRVDIR